MPKPRRLNKKTTIDKKGIMKTYHKPARYPSIPVSIDDIYITAAVNQR